MDQGLLVPDELVVDLVVDRVNQEDWCKRIRSGRFSADHSSGRSAYKGAGRSGTETGLCH